MSDEKTFVLLPDFIRKLELATIISSIIATLFDVSSTVYNVSIRTGFIEVNPWGYPWCFLQSIIYLAGIYIMHRIATKTTSLGAHELMLLQAVIIIFAGYKTCDHIGAFIHNMTL